MSEDPNAPPDAPAPFAGRDGYERRRLTDAARLLPALAALLFALPILWAGQSDAVSSTARGGLYLFIVWAVLIAAARLLAFALSRAASAGGGDAPRP